MEETDDISNEIQTLPIGINRPPYTQYALPQLRLLYRGSLEVKYSSQNI
jgi:hypothetical protein